MSDEVGTILDMGVDIRYNSPVTSMKALLAAIRSVSTRSSSAPARRAARISIFPAATRADRIHIGIDWLESVAFGHIHSIGERVLIIGVGNTAMDCCRTSRRLGGKDIKVMARRPRGYFKASPWELDDAEEEGIEIVINHAPKRFVIENGKLTGMEFERLEWDAEAKKSRVIDTVFLPADDVILAIGQENAFPWIERDLGIEFDKWEHAGGGSRPRSSPPVPGVFFGGDAAWGPKNIIWAVEHGHQAAISIHNHCQGIPVHGAPQRTHEPHQPEDGHQRVELSQRLQSRARARRCSTSIWCERFEKLNIEVELGFTAEQTAREVQRCLNCDIETVFTAEALHRVRRLHRHLPAAVPDHHARRRGRRTAAAPLGARGESGPGSVRLRAAAANRRGSCSRTKISASTAACARSAAPPRPGTCRNSTFYSLRRSSMHDVLRVHASNTHVGRKRFRAQAGECERNRIGQRQRPADAGDFPHGHSGLRQESVPVEHSGPAHLVRNPREQGRLRRARARLRSDGRDELADLRARRPRGPRRRLPAVRFVAGRSTPSCIATT